MKLDNILTNHEKERLRIVAKDPAMLGAIKKVVLSAVYFDGTLQKDAEPEPQKNFCLAMASQPGVSNEALGANLKASLAAVQLLENGFKELEKFGIEETKPKITRNEAR